VAVGLAFKDIFQNFFAGVILLWKFPFEPGDFIVCADVKGRVMDTRLRMTTVRNPSGELIIVPNSVLVGNPLDVLTDEPLRRNSIVTRIAFKEDLEAARRVVGEGDEELCQCGPEEAQRCFCDGI
jgi:small-conductance mechanosensitive channel